MIRTRRTRRPRSAWLSLLLTGCASLVGCTTTAPALGLSRSLYPGTADLDEAELSRRLDTPLWLPRLPRGAVVWLEIPWVASAEPEASRLRLQNDLVRALDRDPFGSVDVAPTTRERPRWLGGAHPDLERIRSVAAHMQADLVLPVEAALAVSPGVEGRGGLLGDLLSLPLLPLAMLLGDPIATAHASAEICAIDVRTGVIVGCACGIGHERARPLFSGPPPGGRGFRERALSHAFEAAADDLHEKLQRRLDARERRPRGAPRQRRRVR